MFARVSTYQGAPDMVTEGARVIGEITPELRQMPGFEKGYLLVDPKSGKAISISLWETEADAARGVSPTSTGGHMRQRIAQALGFSGQPATQLFEVGTELVHRSEGARFARVSEYYGPPGKVDDGIRILQDNERTLTQMPGLHEVILFVDRKSGRAISVSLWDSEDAMSRSSAGVNPIRDSIARGFGATDKPTIEVFEVAGEIPQRARKAA